MSIQPSHYFPEPPICAPPLPPRLEPTGMSAPHSPPPAPTSQIAPASPLFLREDEIRRGIEMLYFGYSALTRSIDEGLAAQGLGRAHHRALYFISRQPDLTVKDLLRLLAITKQSLGRVLNDLIEQGYIETRPAASGRRQKLLRLSPARVAPVGALCRGPRGTAARPLPTPGAGAR